MGSAAIGGLLAHAAFWILLVRGYFSDEIGVRGCAIALVLWAIGLFVLPRVPYAPPFSTYIAIVDIGLVFAIFKGDVRLT
jgi:Na+-driven multidrug efflux pump